jgi:hemolysin III
MPVTHDPLIGAKPRYRGRLHQLALVASVPAGVLLVLAAHSPGARIAAAIYACSLTGLFATSSLYNRLLGTIRLRPWMRWLDHSMIYILIAGSYTPVCWVALPRDWSIPLLSVVWTAALGGVLLKVTRLRRMRRVGGALYVTMGWVSLIVLPKLIESLHPAAALLLLAGGALYMIGAVTLWLRKPNPSPHFGYHEVWHAFVVVAGACHFAMTWMALSSA